MIRPFTLLTALLAAFAGAYLFAVKHRAQVLDDQLAAVTEQSRLDGQRIRVLQAQWALEIDPTRLNKLATQFTTLQPMKPAQLVTLSALGQALPPPGAPAPGQNPMGDMPELAAPGLMGTVIAANGLPLPPPEPPAAAALQAAPIVVASAAAQGPANVSASLSPIAAPVPASRPVRLAPVHRLIHQPVTRLAQNIPDPVYAASPYDTSARLQPAAVQMPLRAAAVVTPASAPAPGGSMLGMSAAALAPPQPLGSDN